MNKELTPLQAFYELGDNTPITDNWRIVETALEAFEIIKEKEVNVHNFKEILIKQGWVYEQYLDEENDPNTSGHQFAYRLLTQEEYELLKGVLDNE